MNVQDELRLPKVPYPKQPTQKNLMQLLGITSRKEYLDVVPALFVYLFYGISQDYFINYCERKGLSRKEALRIKDIARMSGYILKNCKLYAWQFHVCRNAGLTKPRYEAYHVLHEDALLLSKLNLSHLPIGYKAFTLQEFDKLINAVTSSSQMKQYCGKFISKKMSFLMKSYGHKRGELESMLNEAAITALYKQYPRYESELHFINVAKAAIHNVGQSFITHSTAKVRNQLLPKDDNGDNGSVLESLSTISELPSPESPIIALKENFTALVKVSDRLSPRSQIFVHCLAGGHHPPLSEALGQDNSIAADTMNYDRYVKKVQNFFGYSEQRTQRIFTKLREGVYETNLGAYNGSS